MYAKIFSSMFDGTLATVGPWEAVVTFQQLLILCEPDGTIDMTIDAISRRTTIPIEILKTGIETLEKPDEESRTPDEDGRRIMKLHDERSWGWRIVNYTKYRSFKTPEEKREYMREYMREYRKKSKSGKGMSGKLGHADADADAEEIKTSVDLQSTVLPDNPLDSTRLPIPTAKPLNGTPTVADQVATVFDHWRETMKSPHSKISEKRAKAIKARLKDGYTVDQLKQAVFGCSVTPHNMGLNDRDTKYNDIELICRDAGHVDRFIQHAIRPPTIPKEFRHGA